MLGLLVGCFIAYSPSCLCSSYPDMEGHWKESVKTQPIFINWSILACDHFILSHWSFQTVLDNGTDTQAQPSLIAWPSSFATRELSLPILPPLTNTHSSVSHSHTLALGSSSHICLWVLIMHVYRDMTPWVWQCITVSRTVAPDSSTLHLSLTPDSGTGTGLEKNSLSIGRLNIFISKYNVDQMFVNHHCLGHFGFLSKWNASLHIPSFYTNDWFFFFTIFSALSVKSLCVLNYHSI